MSTLYEKALQNAKKIDLERATVIKEQGSKNQMLQDQFDKASSKVTAKKEAQKATAGGKNKASGNKTKVVSDKRQDKGALTGSSYEQFEKTQSQYVVPKVLRNASEAYIDNSISGTLYKMATGNNITDDKRAQNPYDEQLHSGVSAGVGQLLGQTTAFMQQSGLAAPLANKGALALSKTKLGQAVAKRIGEGATVGIAENLIDAGTVGLAQNVGMAYGEGLRGQELAKDVALNTGLEMGLGAGLELAGKGIGKVADKVQQFNTSKQAIAQPEASVIKTQPEILTEKSVETTPKTVEKSGKPTKAMGADLNKNTSKRKKSKSIANREHGAEYEYDTASHKQREEAAKQRVQVDYEGEYKDLSTKQSYTDEDFATGRKLFDSEMASGNDVKASRLMKKIAEQSSQKGQELEAVKHLSDNTASGKVYKGHQKALQAENKIKEVNPAQHSKATSEVNEYVKIIKTSYKDAKNRDEFVQKVKETIDKMLEPKVGGKKKIALRDQLFDAIDKIKLLDADNVDDLIDEVGNIIKSKYKIPVLTSEQARKISDLMEQAENAVGRDKERLIGQVDQIIADLEKSTLREKLKSLQRMSLLSSPKTLVSRNMGGNVLLGSAESLKDIPATLADMAVSKFTGERTTTIGGGGKHKAGLKGLGKGVIDQLDDIKTGIDTSPARGQYELPNKTIWDVNKSNNKAGKVFNKTMNFMDKVIGKTLQMGDRPFYEAAYQSRKAELENLVSKGKAHLTAEQIDESAKLFALDRTFQSNTKLSQWAKQVRETVPFGDLIVPFTQTPANIIDKLLDYSPAGLGRALFELGKVGKGTFDQKRFVDIVGRMFTGSGAILLGYTLYNKGLMTADIYNIGGKDENNARTLAGEQNYAIKFGDTSITVDWADPVGSLLMLGADFAAGLGEKEELLEAVLGGVITAVDGVFDRSFLSGLTDLFDNVSNEGVAKGMIDTLVSQIGSQVVPNIVKSSNRVIDPVKRETYDADPIKKQLNVIKSGIPGLSQTLPEKKNVAGQTVMQYQGRDTGARALESLLLPYNKSTKQEHATNDYLLKMYEKTGNNGVLLDQAPKSFSFDSTSYKIETAEQMSKFQQVQGKTAVKLVEELRKDKEFQAKSTEEQAKAIQGALTEAKNEAVKYFLISNKLMTKEEYYQSVMDNDHQKAAIKDGLTTATKLGKAQEVVKKAGLKGASDKGISLYMAMADAGIDEDTMRGYSKSVSDDAVYEAKRLMNAGVGLNDFQKEYANAKKYDKNDNGIDKAEMIAYLNTTDYSREKKNALLVGMTNTKKNYY